MEKVSVFLPVFIKDAMQIEMTKFAIAAMRHSTKLPFELVIVETGTHESRLFEDYCDVHISFPKPAGYVKELNAGLDACTGTKIAVTGNDVFMAYGWLEALLECFNISDCGIATLSSSDLKDKLSRPTPRILEGVWGPLMMFGSQWRFDPDYDRVFIDTDLIMRVYAAGLRSYRNWSVMVHHLGQVTHQSLLDANKQNDAFQSGYALFKKKHAKNDHLLMHRCLTEGIVV